MPDYKRLLDDVVLGLIGSTAELRQAEHTVYKIEEENKFSGSTFPSRETVGITQRLKNAKARELECRREYIKIRDEILARVKND